MQHPIGEGKGRSEADILLATLLLSSIFKRRCLDQGNMRTLNTQPVFLQLHGTADTELLPTSPRLVTSYAPNTFCLSVIPCLLCFVLNTAVALESNTARHATATVAVSDNMFARP